MHTHFVCFLMPRLACNPRASAATLLVFGHLPSDAEGDRFVQKDKKNVTEEYDK